MQKGGVSGRGATAMAEHGPGEGGLAPGDEHPWMTVVPPSRRAPGPVTRLSPRRLQRERQSARDCQTPAVSVLFAEIR